MDQRPKYRTIKVLEDNLEENLDDLGYGDSFEQLSPCTTTTEASQTEPLLHKRSNQNEKSVYHNEE